ncbi:6-hydroxymethylpterin diphosphokinase MptE-like protein [Leptospira jelokensis]|uniref:6-hydroxymethylpterin diphosphokinase MptE-like protein n=1 Tax=Leptospira jelokensis TaxID=2484931 RepID=UPI00313459F2
MGALHSVRSLLTNKGPHSVVLFWEPNPNIYELPSFQKEADELIQNAKEIGLTIEMITGPNPNWSAIKNTLFPNGDPNQTGIAKWTLYESPNYERLFPDLVNECRNQFRSQFQSHSTNESTIKHFQKVWTHNYLKNKTNLESAKTDVHWFQSFSAVGPNVLFLGASPSLESVVETIKSHREQLTIFASDTALGYLVPNGIFPDYIVSFDSGRGTLYHFLTEFPKEIPIITWLGGASFLFELPNPKILVNTGHPLDQIVGHLFQLENKQNWPIYQNPSLNLLGMVLSITKGIVDRKFILSGVSFISEMGKSHCKGTGYERYYLPQIHRKQSLESLTKRLYSGVRRGKNQIVWEDLNSQKEKNPIQFLSKESPLDLTIHPNGKPKLHSFQGFPPKVSDLVKWADQDQSGIISVKTLNTWLRFSPG